MAVHAAGGQGPGAQIAHLGQQSAPTAVQRRDVQTYRAQCLQRTVDFGVDVRGIGTDTGKQGAHEVGPQRTTGGIAGDKARTQGGKRHGAGRKPMAIRQEVNCHLHGKRLAGAGQEQKHRKRAAPGIAGCGPVRPFARDSPGTLRSGLVAFGKDAQGGNEHDWRCAWRSERSGSENGRRSAHSHGLRRADGATVVSIRAAECGLPGSRPGGVGSRTA